MYTSFEHMYKVTAMHKFLGVFHCTLLCICLWCSVDGVAERSFSSSTNIQVLLIQTTPARSRIHCSILCSRTPDCNTLFYSSSSCGLYKAAVTGPVLPNAYSLVNCQGGDCPVTCSGNGDKVGGICVCFPGFTGVLCETDIDECSSSPCYNNGTCTEYVDSFTCQCLLGTTGETCQTDIDECSSSPCQNSGTCLDGLDQYSCLCTPGYTGSHCTADVDECIALTNPCLNSGTCTNSVGSFSCACPTGFSGLTCEIDPCSSSPCLNGGSCTLSGATYSCLCPAGWKGTHCETTCTLSYLTQNLMKDDVPPWEYHSSTDTSGCRTLCTSKPLCLGWTVNTASDECWLHDHGPQNLKFCLLCKYKEKQCV